MYALDFIGYNYFETQKFIIDRPNGLGNYLFLFFISPVHILIDGQMITTKPFATVIFRPDTPQYYAHETSGFTNDWFHFTANKLEEVMASLGLPLDQVFYLEQTPYIRNFIRDLEFEYKMQELAYLENIDAQLTSFFIHLARTYHHLDEEAGELCIYVFKIS